MHSAPLECHAVAVAAQGKAAPHLPDSAAAAPLSCPLCKYAPTPAATHPAGRGRTARTEWSAPLPLLLASSPYRPPSEAVPLSIVS